MTDTIDTLVDDLETMISARLDRLDRPGMFFLMVRFYGQGGHTATTPECRTLTQSRP